MPTRDRVQSLIDHVLAGKSHVACEEFYHDDVVTQENSDEECVGLAAYLDRQTERLKRAGDVHDIRCDSYLLDGDRTAINWILEATTLDGQRFVLDEVAYQKWDGDKIIRERLFYNPFGE